MPPLRRDPWAWLTLLAIVPLLAHAWGAPLGVPVADDFDYLHRVLLTGGQTLFDGCGSVVYWRPLSRQGYYVPLANAILGHPLAVALGHAVLLALTALLLYRALRPRTSGLIAMGAATFPLLMESSRMLIAWPSNFQDLAAMLFASLALHEATRGRLATALAALLGSLFSKEAGALAALLLPWWPLLPAARAGTRRRWMLATAVLLVAWGSLYATVHVTAGLSLPSDAETDARVHTAPLLERYLWACWSTLRAAISLPASASRFDAVAGWACAALAVAMLALAAFSAEARSRLRRAGPLVLWGAAWFAAASVTLIAIFPTWAAYRGVFGALGLGIGLSALLGAAHPSLAATFLVLRIALFALSPGPPPRVADDAQDAGAAIDFPKLARLQRFVSDVRGTLEARYPTLPAGSAVVQHNFPLMSEYAFVQSKALQSWYRDSTLRWVRFADWRAAPDQPVVTFVEYQHTSEPQVALVDPDAMRGLLDGVDGIRAGRWSEALEALVRAARVQTDTTARVFLGAVAAKRALCLTSLGRFDEAEAEARHALVLYRYDDDARYVLGSLWLREGRLAEAEAQLDTLLRQSPTDRSAIALREEIRTARAARP